MNVRSTQIDGEPWFVEPDVCRALSLPVSGAAGGASRYLGRLVTKERTVIRRGEANGSPLFGNSNAPSLSLISKLGLYKLIMRSDKAEAVVFQHWVTREALPSIRKTGSYALTDHDREAMPLPMDIPESFATALGHLARPHGARSGLIKLPPLEPA
ncbi:prophage antirepressor-like protein [Brevundimonas bullata]|uniref:Prophage antirepressor-like protein n=1 Tax=Brevundimonas bullata TaxID=13160 RepID=A0A7W7IQF4_9CAUL|nr:BRO family protein [Brevundimonas bullata]MBB4798614.1 prophage antirepressor-like protein [Brevundimonas bullata]MBB6383071.1 prophage antirepressor-like protein [Brevundimonas bullata]